MIAEAFRYIRTYRILIPIIILGWIVNLSQVIPFQAHLGHDTYWHMALIRIAFKTFPFQVPIYSGAQLGGYNYLLDLFMYMLTWMGISAEFVYLLVVPVIYLFSVSILGVIFAKRYNNSIYFVASFIGLLFMATPFSYLLSLYRRGSLFFGFNFPTAMQSPASLTNMAYAMTIPLVLVTMIVMLKEKLSMKDFLVIGAMVALSFGIKFYGGVVLLCLVGSFLFFRTVQTRNFRTFWVASAILIVATALPILIFYNPFTSAKTGSVFAFYPLATVHPFIEDPDGLYIKDLVLARYSLIDSGHFSLRLIAIELFTVALFLIYNSGSRIVAFFALLKKGLKKDISSFDGAVLTTIFASTLMSILLIQKGGDWWNTVQFFGYSLLLLNIYTSQFLYDVSRYNIQKWLVYASFIVLTFPLNIELVMKSVKTWNSAHPVSSSERQALGKLSELPYGTVFAARVPLDDTAYIPALSGKPIYYADENVMGNIGVDYEPRKKLLSNAKTVNIKSLDVDYFYILKKSADAKIYTSKINAVNYPLVFENDEIVIYKTL